MMCFQGNSTDNRFELHFSFSELTLPGFEEKVLNVIMTVER